MTRRSRLTMRRRYWPRCASGKTGSDDIFTPRPLGRSGRPALAHRLHHPADSAAADGGQRRQGIGPRHPPPPHPRPPTASTPPNAAHTPHPPDIPDEPLQPITAVQASSGEVASLSAPADLWDRIRRGFAMPDLQHALVQEREQWYAARPDYMQRMTERSSKYLFHI